MRLTTTTIIGLLGTTLLLTAITGCDKPEAEDVRLERRAVLKPLSSAIRRHSLRIGMGALITPKEGYIYYRHLKSYLEGKLKMPIQLVDRDTYEQMNKSLETREVDAAFICAGPYVEGHDKFGLELLAVPLVNGKPVYYSYILVPKDSPASSLKDLRGKTFAFTDPKSNSGTLIPTYMLSLMHETPKKFFKKVIYTHGHDRSIKAVAQKVVDGAAVDSLIWEHFSRMDPSLALRIRIIARSDPSGIPPLVARADFDKNLKRQIQEFLFSMHEDPEGKKILRSMMIDKFVAGNDHNYDSIRDMNNWIARQGRVN